jgi:hypothetical protein
MVVFSMWLVGDLYVKDFKFFWGFKFFVAKKMEDQVASFNNCF